MFRQLTPVCFVVTIGLARFGCLKATLGTLLYPRDARLFQRFGKRFRMSADARSSAEYLGQFGLAGIGVRMRQLDQ